MFSLLKLELALELERERATESGHPPRRRAERTRWRTTMPKRVGQEERS